MQVRRTRHAVLTMSRVAASTTAAEAAAAAARDTPSLVLSAQ